MGNKEILFVYGTLKDPSVQMEVVGKTIVGSADVLTGYRKSEIVIDGENYPAIVPDTKSNVDGLVVYVTREELGLIDAYETDVYKRFLIVLKSGKTAWAYAKR